MTKLTPLKAVRAHCVECCGGSGREASLCPAIGCPIHPIRSGRNKDPKTDKKMVPSVLKAIRKRCLDCCGFSPKAVRECDFEHCALWPYRFGTNPARKRNDDPEEKSLAHGRFFKRRP